MSDNDEGGFGDKEAADPSKPTPQNDRTVSPVEAQAKWKDPAGAPNRKTLDGRFGAGTEQAMQNMLNTLPDPATQGPPAARTDNHLREMIKQETDGTRQLFESTYKQEMGALRAAPDSPQIRRNIQLTEKNHRQNMNNLWRGPVGALHQMHVEDLGIPMEQVSAQQFKEARQQAIADYERLTGEKVPTRNPSPRGTAADKLRETRDNFQTRVKNLPPELRTQSPQSAGATAHFAPTQGNPLDDVKAFNKEHGPAKPEPPASPKPHDVAARKAATQKIAELADQERARQAERSAALGRAERDVTDQGIRRADELLNAPQKADPASAARAPEPVTPPPVEPPKPAPAMSPPSATPQPATSEEVKITGGKGVWTLEQRDPGAPAARTHRQPPQDITPAARDPLPQSAPAAAGDMRAAERFEELRQQALQNQHNKVRQELESAKALQEKLAKAGQLKIESDFADRLNQANTPEAMQKLTEEVIQKRWEADRAKLLQASAPEVQNTPHAPHAPGVGGPRITAGAVADAAGIPTTAKAGLAALAVGAVTFTAKTAYNLYEGQDLKSSAADGAKVAAETLNPLPDTTAAIQQGKTSLPEITGDVSSDLAKLAAAGVAVAGTTTVAGGAAVGALAYAAVDTTIKAGRNVMEDPEKAAKTYLGSIVDTLKDNPGAGIAALPLATIDVAYGAGTTQGWRNAIKDAVVGAKDSLTDAWNSLTGGSKPEVSPAPAPRGIDMGSLQQTSGAVPEAEAKGATTLPTSPLPEDKKLTDKAGVVPPTQRDLLKPMM